MCVRKIGGVERVKQILVLSACIGLGVAVMPMLGCGDEDDSVALSESATADMLGAMKVPEGAPGAPMAPDVGFRVKEVGYYADWKLTKVLSGTVRPGATVFVKVVFSEPVQFTPADDSTARPILYYRVNKEKVRFRVAAHGAKGEDFVSGDVKPKGSGTDDYIGKFVVPDDATGRFRVEIGKMNANKDGETLPAFYAHKEWLEIAGVEEAQEPIVQKTSADTTAPMVVSITHSLDNEGDTEIAEGEPVFAGTDVYTIIQFSEPVTPVITFANGRKEGVFTLSGRGGVHWRGLCKPVRRKGTTFLCLQTVWEDSYEVTVLADTADLSGNRLAEDVAAPVLSVEERVVVPVPQEPVQPVVSVPEEMPESVPEEPSTQPEDDGDHLARAIAVARRIYERNQEIADLFYAGEINYQEYSSRLDIILIEESGLSYYNQYFEDAFLAEIYLKERPEYTLTVALGQYSRRGFTVEWMRLHFIYPEKTKEELLILFRESVRAGKVSIAHGQFWG